MFSFLYKRIKYAVVAIGVSIVIVVVMFTRGYFGNQSQTINQLQQGVQRVVNNTIAGVAKPCTSPITYSLGSFDTRFGLTKAQFLNDIDQAVEIWDKPFGKTFFQLASTSQSTSVSTTQPVATLTFATPPSDLTINLIYDYRQQATDAMNAVGSSIDDQTTVYNALKAKYNSMTAALAEEKSSFATIVADFQTAQDTYNQEVNHWNSMGGAPPREFAALSQEKNALTAQANVITQDQNALNNTVNTINSTAATINKYVALLNSEASQYNSIGSSTGEEFDEGEYVTDATGKRIDIFQYSSHDKLIRVLAHELGHALGLGHIPDNPQAIMYPLNQSTGLSLTADDIAVLKKICGRQ